MVFFNKIIILIGYVFLLFLTIKFLTLILAFILHGCSSSLDVAAVHAGIPLVTIDADEDAGDVYLPREEITLEDK